MIHCHVHLSNIHDFDMYFFIVNYGETKFEKMKEVWKFNMEKQL